MNRPAGGAAGSPPGADEQSLSQVDLDEQADEPAQRGTDPDSWAAHALVLWHVLRVNAEDRRAQRLLEEPPSSGSGPEPKVCAGVLTAK